MQNIREDRWSTAEDDVIRQAVKKYGSNQWDRVATLLPRKSATQCRARWYEVLDPRLSHDQWTKEEDLLLLELANRLPNMWRSIGATLGNRSAGQCHERYEILHQRAALDLEKPGGQAGSMDPNAEKDMVTEANARMASSLGRKAKRKQRERMEDEAKFLKMMEENRVRLKKGLESVQVEPPVQAGIAGSTIDDTARPSNAGAVTTKPKPETSSSNRARSRPKLALPPPSHSVTKQHPLQHITISSRTTAKLAKRLDAMPEPTNV